MPKYLSEAETFWIHALWEEKVTMKEIVHRTGCGEATIRHAAAHCLPL